MDWTLEAVRRASLDVRVVSPAECLKTMGDSIASGVANTPNASAWLVLPADLPLVKPETLIAVARASGEHLCARAMHIGDVESMWGHPVGFGRAFQQQLLSCTQRRGAQHVFAAALKSGQLYPVHVDDPGCCEDLDTLEDLTRLETQLARIERASGSGGGAA